MRIDKAFSSWEARNPVGPPHPRGTVSTLQWNERVFSAFVAGRRARGDDLARAMQEQDAEEQAGFERRRQSMK